MFVFNCAGMSDGQAEIRIQALDWSQAGPVSFTCNDDRLACLLLTDCRSDSGGFFNLLSGCKPVYVEQWLHYLQESGKLKQVSCALHQPHDCHYAGRLGLDDEELAQLLPLIYRVGGFNQLQIIRYLKQRNKPATLATHYSKTELERYRLLNEVICRLVRLKHPHEPQ